MTEASPRWLRDRRLIQQIFIRLCRDSDFRLEPDQAAILTGQTCGYHPLEVWMAMGSIDVMERVASGEHPAVRGAPHA